MPHRTRNEYSRIRRKTIFGFCTVLAILVGTAIVSYHAISRQSTARHWVNKSQEEINSLLELLNGIGSAESALLAYAVTGDQKNLRPYRSVAKNIDFELDQLPKIFIHESHPERMDRLNEISALAKEKIRRMSEAVDQIEAGRSKAMPEQLAKDFSYDYRDALTRKIWEFQDQERQRLIEREAELDQSARYTVHVLIFASLFVLAVVLSSLVFILRELNQRERVSYALRESEERLQLALSVGKLGTWLYLPQEETLTGSKSLSQVLGIPSEFECFSIIESSIVEEDRERAVTQLKHCLSSGNEHDFQFRIRRPDGELRWIHSKGQAIRDASRNPTRITGVMSDITDQKIAEQSEENRRRLEQYRAKMSALAEMASGVAHEVNNPLAVISGNCDRIARSARLGLFEPEKIIPATEKIHSNVHRITAITQGLRDFARDGGSDGTAVVSLNAILAGLAHEMREKFEHAGVPLELAPSASERCLIECRPAQITQAFVQVLQNALDAASLSSSRWVRVILRETPSFWAIDIEDSGAGIHEEIREKIMQPFFTTKEVGKGTGLGLSIAKGHIEGHGGRIQLDTLAHCTRFTIELPKSHAGSAVNRAMIAA